jgi:hypothetical protein
MFGIAMCASWFFAVLFFYPGKHFGMGVVLLLCPPVGGEVLFVRWIRRYIHWGLPIPFAPAFALRQWNWPFYLRPLMAIWWLAHFLIGVAGAILLNNFIESQGPQGVSIAMRIVAFLITGFTMTYCANMYLLLALHAIGFGERGIRVAWRWRILIDIAVAVLAGLLPAFAR